VPYQLRSSREALAASEEGQDVPGGAGDTR